jgi:FAD/FMN-containing dehydrogenase
MTTGELEAPRVEAINGAPSESIAALAARLRGELLQPTDAAYREACMLWNGMIARRPALIVRASGPADVMATVDFAREHRLPISVRGGGHNVAGTALGDGSVAIDLSRMRAVRVDPVSRTARVEGGAKLGDVDHETQAHALAVPLGVVSRTGVGGLTLHGGLGFLTRKYGLSCDNLIAADVVTADGRLVTADESHNADLLWALRGGGGNFGVVTSLEYRLHPIGPDVFVCLVMYPVDQALPAMRFFRDFMATAPEEVMGIAVFWNSPDGEPVPEHARDVPVVVLASVYAGPPAEGERVLAPLRNVTPPLVDLSGSLPFVAAQQLFDPDYPDGRRYYWKSIYLRGLDDDVILALAEHARRRPSPISSMDVWALGGALRREPAGGSAFSHREAPFMLGIEANWDDPTQDAENISWARDLYADMERFSPGGLYLNFPGFAEEGEALVRTAYGDTYARVQAVKSKYDPDNLFRTNFNIAPLADGSASDASSPSK